MRGVCLAGLLLGLGVTSTALAFEGDYIWEDRFKANLARAASGQAKDQYALGVMYLKGRGTRKDPAQALQWFEKAAQQGHVRAAYRAGWLYIHNESLSGSSKKAFPLLRQAAEAGYAPAQYELGQAYASGIGGNWDNAEALNWLAKAKQANYVSASEAFDHLVARMVAANKVKQAQQIQDDLLSPTTTVAQNDQKPITGRAVEALNIILHSQWDGANGPSRVLPSEMTHCQRQKEGIECISKRLTRQLANGRMMYQVQTRISDVAKDGHFQIAYSDKIIDSPIPQASASKASQVATLEEIEADSWECTLGAQKVIHCYNEGDQQYRFTGQ